VRFGGAAKSEDRSQAAGAHGHLEASFLQTFRVMAKRRDFWRADFLIAAILDDQIGVRNAAECGPLTEHRGARWARVTMERRDQKQMNRAKNGLSWWQCANPADSTRTTWHVLNAHKSPKNHRGAIAAHVVQAMRALPFDARGNAFDVQHLREPSR